MTMDIYAQPGSKIIFANPDNGYRYHQEQCAKHLREGGIYTVSRTDVGSCSTDVYIKEAPGIPFNSVMFDDYEESTEGG